jgi:hypothetical protein
LTGFAARLPSLPSANRTLRMIAACRLRYCESVRAYAQRCTAGGKTKSEIVRCLKRYLACVTTTLLADQPGLRHANAARDHHRLLRRRTDRNRPMAFFDVHTIIYPGAWNKLVVVARENDDDAMLNHALIQSRRRYRTAR